MGNGKRAIVELVVLGLLGGSMSCAFEDTTGDSTGRSGSAQAQPAAAPNVHLAASCPFIPTNDVPLDAEQGLPLAFPGSLNLFNVYWAGDWDANPSNFKRADIENAMHAVLGTPYFDRMCQYGVSGFQFEGSAQAAGICGSNPGPVTSTPGVFSFMSCEEYTPFTGVPNVLGAPNPLTCGACGALPIDCFNVLEPLCAATPNPTGNRIYVVFLPKGTTIDDFGRKSCVDYGAFHFQIPSRALFSILPPFVVPLTQGRPLNLAIIPTDCFSSVGDMMASVTHEVVEAASDPLPLAHWLDESTAGRGGRFDFSDIETLLTKGEISDICNDSSVTFTAPDGTPVSVADYWSNHDNQCLSLDVVPPTTTAVVTPAPASGWANTDVTVSLSATDPGAVASGVNEIVFSASGAEAIGETHVSGASASITITAEGITTVTFHAKDNAGNTEAEQSVIVRIDRTAPTIAGTAAPAPNAAGWNNTTVVVTFACADSLSGIASCTAPIALPNDGANQGASGTAVDLAGNTAGTAVSGINIDKTPPVVSYTGNLGTYTVDQTVAISCSATDNLSGIASTTCADINGDAFTFPLGANTFSATAVDVAGNTAGASVTFTVEVTEGSLCNLTRRFSTKPQTADALCTKLDAAAHAPTPEARAGQIQAFLNQLSAKTGKDFSAADAAILAGLAEAL